MTAHELSRRLTIAIDGPAGAGKSTVAKKVADRLGYLYIDTGAMYRALTLKALQAQVDLDDDAALGRLAEVTRIELQRGEQGNRVFLDGVEVTEAIRSPEVTRNVSRVSAAAEVRRPIVELQRQLAAGGGVVVDGRDIASHVLPNAECKFFVTASLQERARRRQADLAARGYEASLEELAAEIERRDTYDSNRAVAPLTRVPDAHLVDTTGLTIEQVIDLILAHCRGD